MKLFLRKILKWWCSVVKVRGRHKLANKLGNIIQPKGGKDHVTIGKIVLPIDHSIPMYRYVYYGIYEEDFVSFLKRTLKPGDVVIEPGANVGYVTAIMSELVGERGLVISLEPSRNCFSMIEKYLTEKNIHLLNKALYNEITTKKFVDKPNVVRTGYSAFNDYTGAKEGDEVYDIETTTVKQLALDFNTKRIAFLKLDIEGAELPAIQGCGDLLEKKQIDYILVETNFIKGHAEINATIQQIMERNGYIPYLPGRKSIRKVNLNELDGKRLDIIWSHIAV
ncbi:MAG TPA: FkbM family methyltransferase [Flavobacteriales bacterium]|nr:FkbM family methyltransferase [Flavobacteriales bacterium]